MNVISYKKEGRLWVALFFSLGRFNYFITSELLPGAFTENFLDDLFVTSSNGL